MKKGPTIRIEKIGGLFEKYKKLLKPPQSSVEKAFQRILEETTNFTLTTDQITYTVSTKTLYIQAPSIIKSEIQLKKPQLLSLLAKELGVENCPKTIL